jgi:hypothetical protein
MRLSRSLLRFQRTHHFASSVVHSVRRRDGQTALVHQLDALLDVGALESHNQRNVKLHTTQCHAQNTECLHHFEGFGSCNDTFGDNIALHDATKDINQDRFHLRCVVLSGGVNSHDAT